MAETIIDQIQEEKDGTVVLVLRQSEPWTDASVMDKLNDRLNGYVSAILDGILVEKFSEFAGRKFKIRLVCYHDPPANVRTRIDRANFKLNRLGIDFHVMQ